MRCPAGAEAQDPPPIPAKRKGGRKPAGPPPAGTPEKVARRLIKNRESAARSKVKQKAAREAARAVRPPPSLSLSDCRALPGHVRPEDPEVCLPALLEVWRLEVRSSGRFVHLFL